MFGLSGEQVVRRIQQLAAQRAAQLPLSVGTTDGQLENYGEQVFAALAQDRKLRRPLQDPRIAAIARSLVTWAVVTAAVGPQHAEARFHVLRGTPTPISPITEQLLGQDRNAHESPRVPGAVRQAPRKVARRRRRLPPPVAAPELLAGLAEAVSVEPTPADDARHDLGYDHTAWLEEWLEPAVGRAAFDGLEASVAAHPDVLAAMHEDREVLFVAAPALHPDDVRSIILATLAPHFDPQWEPT